MSRDIFGAHERIIFLRRLLGRLFAVFESLEQKIKFAHDFMYK